MTPEQAFTNGASAMQSHVAAWLAATGHMDLAPKVLGMELPEPEKMSLAGGTLD